MKEKTKERKKRQKIREKKITDGRPFVDHMKKRREKKKARVKVGEKKNKKNWESI